MTICSKMLGGHDPFPPLATPMPSLQKAHQPFNNITKYTCRRHMNVNEIGQIVFIIF